MCCANPNYLRSKSKTSVPAPTGVFIFITRINKTNQNKYALKQARIKSMRVPSSLIKNRAAAELANDKKHHSLKHSIRLVLGPHPTGYLETRQCKIIPYNFVAENSLFLIHSSACLNGGGVKVKSCRLHDLSE